MTATVLVHSPLVGPATWEPVARVLRGRGRTAVVPSLLDASRTGPPFVGPQAEAVADAVAAAGADRVLLVGHSGAGPLLPSIGVAVRRRGATPVGYLFADAGLPHPGRSRLASVHPSLRGRLAELARHDGMLPPWCDWFDPAAVDALLPEPALRDRVLDELQPVPVALLEEPMPDVPAWPDAPCGYLRFSAAYAGDEAEAAGRGWPVAVLEGGHLLPVVAPGSVADALDDLVARLGVA
ncbi:MAG TPA: hypothetical protein VHF47_07495 [Acidimicrobiales bacterium]|nr:hypothetical protein [Acidimicrobiales bacterium]